MTAEDYERLTAWWRARPRAIAVLAAVNRVLTAVGWVAYPLLLLASALADMGALFRYIVVPLLGFIACTLIRRAVDEPRPYEALPIEPLIVKDTRGKSFPSRHVFSMVMIALSWLTWCWPAGLALLVACVVMAWARVLGGVHYLHDVVAGAALAGCFALVGYVFVGL